MDFDNPEMVESIAYDLKLGDWPRALNRARVNSLANGHPPYTPDEVQDNQRNVNVNDLTHTRTLQQARTQFYGAFLKPQHFFRATTSIGPKHKRQEWNTIVTSQAARVMKRSLPYFESLRSRFALDVLHGIGPSAWEDRDCWCPDPLGIEDVLLPSGTFLTMKNLPFFFLYRSWTAPELIKLTTGPRVDPGWDLELVQACLEWLDTQMMQLRNNNWPEVWSPEKQEERIKSDGGWYAGDQAPRIDCFDFYFWSDESRNNGWRRRIILDPWSTPEPAGSGYSMGKRGDSFFQKRHGFLFNPGKRKYASRLSELVNWQFADLSAVAPFRYHAVRSLGWLTYAVCHLQSRLYSRFNEHLFESMMQLFRSASEEEYQRALKVELVDRGFIDNSIQLVPQAERWQVNAGLMQMGFAQNQQLIESSATAWAQNPNYSRDRSEKTKFQVMAEMTATSSMITSALLQAYRYQETEYQEIFRRLCKKHSRDGDCREFRAACLRLGVDEAALVPEAWEIEAERIIGAGNKTMEMSIAETLWNMRQAYPPEAQNKILRDITLLLTDDAVRTSEYLPEGPPAVTNSQHDAQVALGTILAGHSVTPTAGANHIETAEVWLGELERTVASVNQRGGVPTPQELSGLQNLERHVLIEIALLSRDDAQKQLVKQLGDRLGRASNFIKAFAQRLEQQARAASGGNGKLDPKDAAKIQATVIGAQVKAQNQRQSHAQRMAQRQLQFEQQLRQDEQKARLDAASKDLETAASIKRNRMSSFSE